MTMTQKQHRIVSAGIRDFLCGAAALIITASLTSSFVMSSGTLQWMGSGSLGQAAVVATS
jgi:hypothetical protein